MGPVTAIGAVPAFIKSPHSGGKTSPSSGDPKITFVVGLLLSFPGASYLVALDRLGKLHYSTFATVMVVIGFCLLELVLLDAALIAFWIWPQQTMPTPTRGYFGPAVRLDASS